MSIFKHFESGRLSPNRVKMLLNIKNFYHVLFPFLLPLITKSKIDVFLMLVSNI